MNHDNSPEPDRSRFVDELLAEYHRRVDAGEAVDREQFLRIHPDSAEALRSYFEGTDLVERLASPGRQASPELPAGAGGGRQSGWKRSHANALRTKRCRFG